MAGDDFATSPDQKGRKAITASPQTERKRARTEGSGSGNPAEAGGSPTAADSSPEQGRAKLPAPIPRHTAKFAGIRTSLSPLFSVFQKPPPSTKHTELRLRHGDTFVSGTAALDLLNKDATPIPCLVRNLKKELKPAERLKGAATQPRLITDLACCQGCLEPIFDYNFDAFRPPVSIADCGAFFCGMCLVAQPQNMANSGLIKSWPSLMQFITCGQMSHPSATGHANCTSPLDALLLRHAPELAESGTSAERFKRLAQLPIPSRLAQLPDGAWPLTIIVRKSSASKPGENLGRDFCTKIREAIPSICLTPEGDLAVFPLRKGPSTSSAVRLIAFVQGPSSVLEMMVSHTVVQPRINSLNLSFEMPALGTLRETCLGLSSLPPNLPPLRTADSLESQGFCPQQEIDPSSFYYDARTDGSLAKPLTLARVMERQIREQQTPTLLPVSEHRPPKQPTTTEEYWEAVEVFPDLVTFATKAFLRETQVQVTEMQAAIALLSPDSSPAAHATLVKQMEELKKRSFERLKVDVDKVFQRHDQGRHPQDPKAHEGAVREGRPRTSRR